MVFRKGHTPTYASQIPFYDDPLVQEFKLLGRARLADGKIKMKEGRERENKLEWDEYLDAKLTDDNKNIEESCRSWFTFEDDEITGRSQESPILIIVYLLDPYFKSQSEPQLSKDDPMAGKCPLIGMVFCFPNSINAQIAHNGLVENWPGNDSMDEEDAYPDD